ncbi:hypothetical protein WK92_08065 [Burkholderia ubonensis]|nr:hypothetical protein WJ91_29490 [Burkholderia ubonensis]KVP71764.1 hypothetical protein WJ94_27580 [Burkholderia ubonensis]KVR53145.1 hypothetical protein WK19_19420 [Burkholderia ubonensis]KVV53392.1 hypothetical protein WK82_08665 [Burkholderia ubonensis]KVW25529.1 hypothetical protein WK92_08065 [Burkholderia ubonensis]
MRFRAPHGCLFPIQFCEKITNLLLGITTGNSSNRTGRQVINTRNRDFTQPNSRFEFGNEPWIYNPHLRFRVLFTYRIIIVAQATLRRIDIIILLLLRQKKHSLELRTILHDRPGCYLENLQPDRKISIGIFSFFIIGKARWNSIDTTPLRKSI